jgi:hypothetical protein
MPRSEIGGAARVRFKGDGRIPSGILLASMTGVRLSFRRFGVMPVRVHFTPTEHDPKPSSGPLSAHVKMVPPARIERALLSEPHFECGASTSSTTGARERNP